MHPILRACFRSAPGASRKVGPLALALILQAVLLLGAVFVVVLVPEFRREPSFVVRKKIYLPQKQLEHKVAVAAFQQAVGSPLEIERIRTAALLPSGLPPLPELPRQAFNPVEHNPVVAQSDGLLGRSGVLGALNGLRTESSSASLFGIEDRGRRIVILFDNSATVWNKAAASGVSTEAFVRELTRLVDGLGANTLFGFVPFARKVGTFRDFLVAAGARNKAEAKAWIRDHVRSTRKHTGLTFEINGIQGAFEVAFQMEPDVIFVVSDGDFQRDASARAGAGDVPWKDLERTLSRLRATYGVTPRIHFIGFKLDSVAADALESIARRYRGELRTMGGGTGGAE